MTPHKLVRVPCLFREMNVFPPQDPVRPTFSSHIWVELEINNLSLVDLPCKRLSGKNSYSTNYVLFSIKKCSDLLKETFIKKTE